MKDRDLEARIIHFPKNKRPSKKYRKYGLNRNKEGSIRKINGKVYVDFVYLGERVRESSGLPWNEKNAKAVREQLDKIIVTIKLGTFRFGEVFPGSKNREYFEGRERQILGLPTTPDKVTFNDYAWHWYNLRKNSGRITGRTLREYKSYLNLYLIPFFGEITFAELNADLFEEFIAWCRERRVRGISVGNKSINKYFVALRMICKQVALKHQWGSRFDPFFGFKRLQEEDARAKIFPFSVQEQKGLLMKIPDHWKPYFSFAFSSGLRQGEEIALKPFDVDWDRRLLHVRRAITLDENGKRIEGTTKNRYSRRTIKLIPAMLEPLKVQREIHSRYSCDYFFCSLQGRPVDLSNLRRKVWIPALKRAGLRVREMRQTRHSFATAALSCGENPLWIAKVLGHKDAEMIIKVYSKYIENAGESADGTRLNTILTDYEE